MTEDEEMESFARRLEDPRNDWRAAWLEARQQLQQKPEIRSVDEYGFAAWEKLTPAQRHHALKDLMYAYFWLIHDEEQQKRLAEEAKAGKTFVLPDDAFWVEQAFGEDVDPADEDAILTGVLAAPLHRVLQELKLLQFKVALLEQDGGVA